METIESNKAIAEFMGADFNEKGDFCYFKLPANKGYQAKNLKYHTSWDWIIPVVEKIEQDSTIIFEISRNHAGFNKITEFGTEAIYGKSADTKIEAVYTAVTNFIEFKRKGRG